jgi:NAD(P)H-dependent FMN reductase
MEPIELKLVVGSTRPERGADVFLPWLVERAERHGRFAVEVLDLRGWELPMFQETWASATQGYSDERVRRWNETIVAGEAFLFVTPEYNHSVPAVLKNALATDAALTILLDDLGWWGDALRRARAEGELPPARQRRSA